MAALVGCINTQPLALSFCCYAHNAHHLEGTYSLIDHESALTQWLYSVEPVLDLYTLDFAVVMRRGYRGTYGTPSPSNAHAKQNILAT